MNRMKFKTIYGLLGSSIGTALIVLADFLGGEFLPLWVYGPAMGLPFPPVVLDRRLSATPATPPSRSEWKAVVFLHTKGTITCETNFS